MEGIAREVAVEVGGNAAEEEVRVLAGDGGVVEVAEGNAVGRVGALEVTDSFGPLVVAGVVTIEECAVGEEGKVAVGLADDADFVSILEVASDT